MRADQLWSLWARAMQGQSVVVVCPSRKKAKKLLKQLRRFNPLKPLYRPTLADKIIIDEVDDE